jgi:hypothetical protein
VLFISIVVGACAGGAGGGDGSKAPEGICGEGPGNIGNASGEVESQAPDIRCLTFEPRKSSTGYPALDFPNRPRKAENAGGFGKAPAAYAAAGCGKLTAAPTSRKSSTGYPVLDFGTAPVSENRDGLGPATEGFPVAPCPARSELEAGAKVKHRLSGA